MGGEPVAEVFSRGEFEEALVIDQPDTDIAVLERDPPGPPAFTDEVVGGVVAYADDGLSPGGGFFEEGFIVPVGDSLPSAPYRGGGMFCVTGDPSMFACDQGTDT